MRREKKIVCYKLLIYFNMLHVNTFARAYQHKYTGMHCTHLYSHVPELRLGWECSERKRVQNENLLIIYFCLCVIKAQYLYTIHKAIVKWPFITDTLYKQTLTHTHRHSFMATNFTEVYCTKAQRKKRFKAYTQK